jgi:hypothetical protein
MKVFLIFLSLFSLILSSKKDPEKTRVVVIGIDGFLQNCLFESKHTAFDYFKNEGSYTNNARTSITAISGPGWNNILCGFPIELTGVIDNDYVPGWVDNSKNPVTSFFGDKPYPCLFSELKKNKKDLSIKVSSTYNWEWFANFTGSTIDNKQVDEVFYCLQTYKELDEEYKCEEQVIKRSLSYIQDDFDLLFNYFMTLDETGHNKTFCGKEYVTQISVLNDYIEQIIQELKNNNIYQNTYVIITTDHGAAYLGLDHGFQNDDNVTVPLFIIGPNIKKGYHFKSPILDEDVTPTILEMFGYSPNDLWRGKSIKEAFTDLSHLNELKFLQQ